MPHLSHSHSHGGIHERADIFTNANTLIGGATSFLSMLFFVARAVDTFGDYEKKFAEMSYQAMIAGFIISLYASVGSTLCHRALNKLNQEKSNLMSESRYVHQTETNIQSEVVNISVQNEKKSLFQSSTTHNENNIVLTHFQKLMLLGDFIGHASDVASPILFIMLYAFEMQKYQKAMLYIACFAMGLFSSVASVRTCRNALLEKNVGTGESRVSEQGGELEHSHAKSEPRA